MKSREFERTPVRPEELQPARYFAASFAGEHVAGTEFVIGAMFVTWGVSAGDVLYGLLWGNGLAVLTWALVCAPIATDTRLTLYAYLEKIAGPGIIRIYSAVNGTLFCVLAGAMITVSASAIRILFAIPPQVNWYPSSPAFVLVALAVGAVVVSVAALGFRRVAQFAEVCAPWMILMFIVGAMALWPLLIRNSPAAADGNSLSAAFSIVANTHIWQGDGDLGFWHVLAFSWICNLAMHGGLGDMTLLRFARSPGYGYFSALGMFIGHYCAWICAGIMGAGAALMLNASITQLDAGAVAHQALGSAGIIAVVIAGWTTSNPTIYRAGLAFQSLNARWNRVTVTLIVGAVTTLIACFPFVFTRLLDFVGIMGLILAPIGAVIVTEHQVFPRIGLTRYWSNYRGDKTNLAALMAWLAGLATAALLALGGIHLFFLLIPTWVVAMTSYIGLACFLGAGREVHAERARLEAKTESERRAREAAFLATRDARKRAPLGGETGADGSWRTLPGKPWATLALASLLACLALGISVALGADHEVLRNWLIAPSLIYFLGSTLWARRAEKDPRQA